MELKTALLTVGLPVYNGEKTIKQVLDSILEQTFQDFILTISDNASTDLTEKICKDYAKKDNRIKYVRQTKNIGLLNNFNFLLENAKTKYFVWIAADDHYDRDFFKKNIKILESNENFVGSTSDVIYSGKSDMKDPGSSQVIQLTGSYEEKVVSYLKFNRAASILAIYRTEQFQKSMTYKEYASWDPLIMVKVLEYGDLNVINENLCFRSPRGLSTKSYIAYMRKNKYSFSKYLIPYWYVTNLCIHKFGIKFFFKNFLLFFRLNGNGSFLITKDFLQLCKRSLLKKK